MSKEIYERLNELKLERQTLAATRDEELAKFKQVSRECDKAYDNMVFTRSEMVKARRERYAMRGIANNATGDDREQAWEDYSIADQVYQDTLERFKAEDKTFRDVFAKKRIAGELYNYYRDQVKEISGQIANLYKKLPKKKGKGPKHTPPTTEADE